MVKKQVRFVVCGFMAVLSYSAHSQTPIPVLKAEQLPALFQSTEALPIKLNYSIRDVRKGTKDSTYINSKLSYLQDASWIDIGIGLRSRGNFRKEHCYNPPMKLKLPKEEVKETLFEGHKRLKLVLPCMLLKRSNDDVLKEYLAYKLYEQISPYHFKSRLVHIEFSEQRPKKNIDHWLKGILLEDDKNLARRFNGQLVNRSVHPLQQAALTSIQNDLFQYMIGNTDYSTAYQHNQSLLFIDKTIIPLPYDFDMSGLVDASYAVVSEIPNEPLDITDVKQRRYRGFRRDTALMQQVRSQFLESREVLLAVADSLAGSFDEADQYLKSRKYLESFFEILVSDVSFKKEILDKARMK